MAVMLDTREPGSRPTATPTGDRRTFAIISHPDAGKTTLTEKLLLVAGAVRMAGAVKARGDRRRTRSDWMEIERARGISVSSSVMTFTYRDLTFNLLDTPGHEDFSEDTYRTLTAVDSAVMVIDAAKGIEAQTRKLLEVCRLRDIPIVTFVNKLDRESRDPFELLDEIESTLALDITPMNWPVGMGQGFHGCAPIARHGDAHRSDELEGRVPGDVLEPFREAVELASEAYPAPDVRSYREGHLTPVYFGSALREVGVRELLDGLAEMAPAPRPQPTTGRTIGPDEARVAGFVFKVQANMDKNHRDRIAFVRLCSGRFRRGMKLRHVRTGKPMAVANPIFFFAQDRELAEEAFPGDIIGIPNHGTLRVGDTLTEGEELRFTGIPDFAPEILSRVRLDDPLRAKQLQRALDDLAEEGLAQVFKPLDGRQRVVGVVGQLQLDVLSSRMSAEYDVKAGFEPAPYETVRWVTGDGATVQRFIARHRSSLAEDREGALVLLARNAWELGRMSEDWPDLTFRATRERA